MLETYLKPILSKHRGIALGVWGEAGIGKSYRVARMLQQLPCHCLSLHATTPLQSLVSQLGKPKKLPLWADKTLQKVQQGEQVDNGNFISALSAALAGLAPFVLHLEDIHEANSERLTLLKDLAQSIQKLKGVGLLVTSRQTPDELFVPVKLELLSREASNNLVEQELAAVLPPEGLEFIYSKAAGNPLFTLEYLRFLARQGNFWNDGKMWHWRKPEQERMPVVVEALIEQTIAQAKRDDRQRYVLESKAVLPQGTSNALWQKVARVSETELVASSRGLAQQGVFKHNDFAHPLFREVTLHTLSKERKQHLSRRAINALSDDPVQAVTFIDDAALDKDKALGLLRRAAETLQLLNPYQAAQCLVKASRYADDQTKAELAFKAAQWISAYNLGEATTLAEQASVEQSSPELLYQWSEWLARDHQLEKALKVTRRLEQSEVDKCWWLINLHSWAGEHSQAVAHWQSCQEASRANLPMATLQAVLYSLNTTGHFQESLNLAQQALANVNTLQEQAELLHLCGMAHSFLCDYVAAHQCYAQAAKLFEDLNQQRALGITLYRIAILNYYEGEMDCATVLLHKAETLLASTDATEKTQVDILLATIEVERGHYEAAEKVMLEQRERLLLFPVSSELVDLEIRFCYLYRSWQTSHSRSLVRQFALRAWQWANTLGNARLMISTKYQRARAELFAGEARAGLALAQEALKEAQELPFPILEGYIHHAVFQAKQALGDASAIVHLETAVNFFRERNLLLDTYFYGLELACIQGDFAKARELKAWLKQRRLHTMLRADFLRVLDDSLVSKETVLSLTQAPRLEVLGVMRLCNDRLPEKLRGNKRQELLALLLEARIAGRSEVTRLGLFDNLYPDDDESKAANNLKNLVNTVRDILGSNAIITTNNGYALGQIASDAEEFLKTGDTQLWRGLYLEELSIEGQETVRESLYITLFEKAKGLLEIDPKEAVRVGKMLLGYDPYNRDYLQLCVQALKTSNNHKSLTRLYGESQKVFAEVGEVMPKSWQDFLAV